MIDWITRQLIAGGSAVAQLFIPKDAVNFDVVAGVMGLGVLAFGIAVVALWPRRR